MEKNKNRRRLVLSFFVVFHTLLPRVISKPWEIDNQKYRSGPRIFLNTRIVASVLYHLFIDVFKENCEIIKGNVAHLTEDQKVRIRTNYAKFGKLKVIC